MPGILADANCEGHVRLLLRLLNQDWRQELWSALNMSDCTFADVNLQKTDSDVIVWQKCQQDQLVLITINRNETGVDSLQEAIRTLNAPSCLPVLTIGDADRLLADRAYAERAADKLLEFLTDLGNLHGTGRLYIP